MRFLIALWAAKTVTRLLRLLRRNATQFPGVLAMKLCPDFLRKIEKPARIIAITGSNGKTTTTNFVADTMETLGVAFLSNRLGSNLQAGIATSLATAATWKGAARVEVAVFEVDERSSKLIYANIIPELLLVTNLTNDTIKRNAHPDYIRWFIESALPENTRLVLNADDPISREMGAQRDDRVFFALESDADYRVLSANDGVLRMATPAGEREFPLIHDSQVNIANQAGAIALLSEFGLADIGKGMRRAKMPKLRYNEEVIGGLTVVEMVAKSPNPVATSVAFKYVAAQPGQKAVIMANDDIAEFNVGCENPSWYYVTDFEALADSSIRSVVFAGPRHLDAVARALLAGVPQYVLRSTAEEAAAADVVDLDGVDKLYVLHDNYMVNPGEAIKARLRQRLEGAA